MIFQSTEVSVGSVCKLISCRPSSWARFFYRTEPDSS